LLAVLWLLIPAFPRTSGAARTAKWMSKWCDVPSASRKQANLSISCCRRRIRPARCKECLKIVNSCKEEMKRRESFGKKNNSIELKKMIFPFTMEEY
jgi:hypothetical protein